MKPIGSWRLKRFNGATASEPWNLKEEARAAVEEAASMGPRHLSRGI